MHYQVLLVAAAALVVGATAAKNSVVVSSFTAISYQAASDLQNASTYLPLTRQPVKGSASQLFKEAYRNGVFGQYGLSPTTSFFNDSVFYTPIKFGDQTFNVLVDTGSSDTWLLAEGAQCFNFTSGAMVSGLACNFGPKWNQNGCVPIANENFNINYGGTYVDTGSFCTIDVTLGGITAKNQQVAAVSAAAEYGPAPASGLVGFAYPALTFAFSGTNISANDRATDQVPYSPLFTTMYQQGQIPPVFSIALSRPSPLRSNDGYIGLGGLPPVLAIGAWGTASIQYVAMNSPGGGYLPTTLPYPQHEWYTISPDAFLYQSGSETIYKPTQWTALQQPAGNLSFESQYILDSGYTALALPPVLADAIASKFNPPAVYNSNTGNYAVLCNAVAPWFAIKIGGVIFPVDKRDMIISDQSGGCMAGTTNGQIYAPYTLGDVFMNNVVVVFDVGSGEMKFKSRGFY